MTITTRHIIAAVVLLGAAFGVGIASQPAATPDQPTTPVESIARGRIDDSLASGKWAEIAAGETVTITAPVRLERRDGGGIIGRNSGAGLGGGWSSRSTPSRIIYNGPATEGAAVELHGSVCGVFQDVVIENGGGGAAIGVKLTNEMGWGSGGHTFERVTVRGFKVGVQAGNAAADHTCSDLTFIRCNFDNNDVAFRAVNDQAVNHHFIDCQINAGIAFDFRRGGNLMVDGGHVGGVDLWLRVGDGGPNAGTFRFTGVRFELNGRSKNHTRLVEATSTAFADVVFDGCQETMGPAGGNIADPLFQIGPNVVVTTRNHVHCARPMVAAVTGGMYRDTDSRWLYLTGKQDAVPTTAFKRSGSGRIRVTGASNSTGAPITGVSRSPAASGADRE